MPHISDFREIVNDIVNGRQPSLIRVRLTASQIAKLATGQELTFRAGDQKVEISKK